MRFAYIQNGIVYDAISVDPNSVFYPDYASKFVTVPDEVQSGWKFDGNAFISPPGITQDEIINSVRNIRNVRLQESDWTQLADIPQSIKDKWASYRQALRDVPQQAGFPTNVQWPVEP